MNVTLTSRTEETRRGHRRMAEELAQRLSRSFHRVLSVDWTLEEEGGLAVASCHVHTPRGDYRATAREAWFGGSMHAAVRKLAQQHRREKEKAVTRRRRSALSRGSLRLVETAPLEAPRLEPVARPLTRPRLVERKGLELRGPVLAAVTHADSADAVLRGAHAQARAAGVPLVVCHILPRAADEAARARAYAWLSERIERVISLQREAYTLVHPTGRVAASLRGQVERLGAGLLVLGPGRTALQMASHDGCPLLVARDCEAGMVLGATDLSDPALPSLEAAAREAHRRERPLCFFHALKPSLLDVLFSAGRTSRVPMTVEESEQRRDEVLGAEERLKEHALALRAEAEVRAVHGWPTAELTRMALRLPVELLVVATRGRRGLAGFLHWGVVEQLLVCAPCPVLVVRRST